MKKNKNRRDILTKMSRLTQEETDFYRHNINHLGSVFKKKGLSGTYAQELLKDKEITMLGLGGAGSSLIVNLIGMGIGKMNLIDFDNIEPSNIPRQFFYSFPDIGKKKTEILKKRIKERNPFIDVEGYNVINEQKNIGEISKIIQNSDLIINAADRPDYISNMLLLQEICFQNNKPFMGASLTNNFTPALVIPYKTACARCMIKKIEKISSKENLLKDPKAKYKVVPYYNLLQGNTFVAREILKFLLIKESLLFNHFIMDESNKRISFEKKEDCICNK